VNLAVNKVQRDGHNFTVNCWGKDWANQDITFTEQRYPDDVMNRLTWIAYMQCKKHNKFLITQVLFHSVYLKMLCILKMYVTVLSKASCSVIIYVIVFYKVS